MNNRIIIFILGVYSAVFLAIMGHLYLNPVKMFESNENQISYFLDYTDFKYSILIFVCGLILLFSFLQLFRKRD